MAKKEKETPERHRSVLRRILKAAGISLGAIILLLIAAIIAGPYLIPTSAVERMVSKSTERSFGRPSKIGKFSMSLIGGTNIVISDLVIEEKSAYGERPFFKADKIVLDARLIPLLADKIVVHELSVENPEISIVRGPDGRFNFEDVPEIPELLEPAEERKPPAERREPPADKREPRGISDVPSFDLSNVTIKNGRIYVVDMVRNESADVSNVEAALEAEFDSRSRTGEIRTATLAFTGFNASMNGRMTRENGTSIVQDFKIDATADILQIGKLIEAAMPLTLEGMLEYKARAEGPLNAVHAQSELLLTDFAATGEMVREPAKIAKLESSQSAVLDLENMTASEILSQLESDDLGVQSKITGSMDHLANGCEMDIAAEGRIDLQRLTSFINAFLDEPYGAAGIVTADGRISGNPMKEIAAVGKAQIEDLEVFSTAMPQPYTEERLSMNYDFSVLNRREVNVRDVTIQSRLLAAKASGTVSPDAADFNATAGSDLDAVSAVLGAMGITPADTSLGGQLASRLSIKTVPGGIRAELDGTIDEFKLSSPQFDEEYAEEQITFKGGSLAGFIEGEFDSLADTQFNLNSNLMQVDASAELDGYTTDTPRLKAQAVITSELERVADTMTAMGLLDPERRIRRGPVKVTLWLESREDEEVPGADTRDGAAPQNDIRGGAAQQNGADGEDNTGEILRQMIDSLTGYQARATFEATDVEYEGVAIDETLTEIVLYQGNLTAGSRSKIGEGTADVKMVSRLTQMPPQHEIEVQAKDIQFRQEIIVVLQKVLPIFHLPLGEFEGRGNAQASLTTAGLASEELIAALDGKGSLGIPGGVHVRIPILAGIPGLGRYTEMDFGTMEADFAAEDGVTDSRAEFKVEGLEMTISGVTNLNTEAIDYKLTLRGEKLGRDLARLLGPRGELPVGITGTIENPRARLQAEGLLGPLERLLR